MPHFGVDPFEELHVDGSEIEKPIVAGEPVTTEFMADQTSAEIEVHELDPGLLLTCSSNETPQLAAGLP